MFTDLIWLPIAFCAAYAPYFLSGPDTPAIRTLPPAEIITEDWS